MYFFHRNLAFMDTCLTSNTVPQMVMNTVADMKTISFTGCITQQFFFISFVNIDSLLLWVMAHGRYVMIHHPSHYNSIMNSLFCDKLVSGLYVVTYIHALLHTVLMPCLSFCASDVHNLFWALQFSYSDVSFRVITIYTVGALFYLQPHILCAFLLCHSQSHFYSGETEPFPPVAASCQWWLCATAHHLLPTLTRPLNIPEKINV